MAVQRKDIDQELRYRYPRRINQKIRATFRLPISKSVCPPISGGKWMKRSDTEWQMIEFRSRPLCSSLLMAVLNVAGKGILHASLLGLVPLVKLRRTGGMAQGELLRFLARQPAYPTALLPRLS